MPAGHCLQLVIEPWYGTSRYVSGGHGVQALLPIGAIFPSGQEKQACAAPRAMLPFPQGKQVCRPEVLA